MTEELRDAYRLLGLEPGAPPEAVKQAYHELAKIAHPDRLGDPKLQKRGEELFKHIKAAYERITAYQSGTDSDLRADAAQRVREAAEARAHEEARIRAEARARSEGEARARAEIEAKEKARREAEERARRLAEVKRNADESRESQRIRSNMRAWRLAEEKRKANERIAAEARAHAEADAHPASKRTLFQWLKSHPALWPLVLVAAAVSTPLWGKWKPARPPPGPVTVPAKISPTGGALSSNGKHVKSDTSGRPAVPPNLVWIPPGTFAMGSPNNEQGRYDWEGPQTQVTITRGFWLARYEVTQAEYKAVMGSNPSCFKGDANLPVETVSWDDAVAYCAKLTAAEQAAGRLPAGYLYRLPTEAEWEYACRAETTTRFSYGDDLAYAQLGDLAWFVSNSGGTPHAVGLKQANAWGLYDMYGNVWEWCSDWYGKYPGGSMVDPAGPASGSYRVIRGGGWFSVGLYCRSAYRYNRLKPGDRIFDVGFRVVLVPSHP